MIQRKLRAGAPTNNNNAAAATQHHQYRSLPATRDLLDFRTANVIFLLSMIASEDTSCMRDSLKSNHQSPKLRALSIYLFRAFVAFALTAYCLLLTAYSQVPSPQSVLGFHPTDDRTIADWTQITNYF